MNGKESVSNVLAHFISELSYDQLPEEVVEKAKNCVLDHIGVAIAGSTTQIGKTIIDLMKSFGGRRESTIIGSGLVPSINASFANGTLSHILDMDDGNRFALGHPGASSIPAAMSLSEKEDEHAKNLVTAIVAGYEVFSRLGAAVNPSHFRRGFHTSGTCGVFGAAAAASRILGLDEKSTANALGIAGTQASGLLEVVKGESRLKPLQPGRAAQSGVLAALLAERGLTAPKTILEGTSGFLRAYTDSYDLKKITDGLGKSFQIMNSYFKFYSACRCVHASVDALLQLLDENSIESEEIEKIHVCIDSLALSLVGSEYEPKTESTAKFSLPYCMAVASIRKRLTPSEFTLKKIQDPKILRLARKIQVEALPELDELLPEKRPAIVEIITDMGCKLERRVDYARGEPEMPAKREDLISKFRMLAKGTISKDKLEKIVKNVCMLEQIKNVRKLTRLLTVAD